MSAAKPEKKKTRISGYAYLLIGDLFAIKCLGKVLDGNFLCDESNRKNTYKIEFSILIDFKIT